MCGRDITIKLDQHFLFGQVLKHTQSTLRRFDQCLSVFDRESVGLKLQFFDKSFCDKPSTTFKCQLSLAKFLLGNSNLALQRRLFCFEYSLKVLLPSDLGLFDRRGRSRDVGVCGCQFDFIFADFRFDRRCIQFNDAIALGYFCTFVDNPQNGDAAVSTRLHFADDFCIAAAFDLALFQHNMIERAFDNRFNDQFAFTACLLFQVEEFVAQEAEHSHQAQEHQQAPNHAASTTTSAR